MSHVHTQPHNDLGHDHVHDHGHDNHGDHGDHGSDGYHATVQGYVKGFVLSVILTAIPFWLVMGKVIESSTATSLVILAFAAVQIVVHMVYFLHLNSKAEGGWTMLSLIFTVVLLVIMLVGSIWVMFHLNTNLMDMPTHESTQNP